MCKNGLKIFEQFKGVFLEARIGREATEKFQQAYGVVTGECTGVDADASSPCFTRKRTGWPGAFELYVYFEAPIWVVESLKKLGYNVFKRKIEMYKYEGGLKEYSWKVSSCELFWYLVDYGYRIGKNAAISFDQYLVRKHLQNMEYTPLFDINYIESENPVYEAKMLAAIDNKEMEETFYSSFSEDTITV